MTSSRLFTLKISLYIPASSVFSEKTLDFYTYVCYTKYNERGWFQ